MKQYTCQLGGKVWPLFPKLLKFKQTANSSLRGQILKVLMNINKGVTNGCVYWRTQDKKLRL